MKKQFEVIRSSAGSGKTYSLVKRFITLSLLSKKNNYYKNILAITFTNAAAYEMKNRVIMAFSNLSEGLKDSYMDVVSEETGMSVFDIQQKSKLILRDMLHNYSDISICTIDRFVYRIIRTFARDLHISQNFDIEMNEDNIINPSVAMILSKIGEDKNLTNLLVDFSISKSLDGKSWDIENDLNLFSKVLFKEGSLVFLEKIKYLKLKEFDVVKNQINKELLLFKSNVTSMGKKACDLIYNKLSNVSSMSGGAGSTNIINFFKQISDCNDSFRSNNGISYLFASQSVQNNINKDKWHSGKASDLEKREIDSIKEEIKIIYFKINDFVEKNYKKYYLNKLIYQNIYSLAVLNEIEKQIVDFSLDNNIKHISEFNKLIFEIIKEEPVPFIFERIGSRYHHFLIDEFQDTSILQWHNLVPLLSESLSNGKYNMVIGDGKQAIYRWRNGEVEQFLNLPNLSKTSNNHSTESKFIFSENYKENVLPYNWRSGFKIVEFNNSFFEKTNSLLNTEISNIYKNHTQIPKKDFSGFVEVDFFDNKKKYKEDSMFMMYEKIVNMLNIYNKKDIAVLVRSHTDISMISNFFEERGLDCISAEGLLLQNSSKVNFIINVIKIINDPSDEISKTHIILFLKNMNNNTHKLQLKSLHDIFVNLKDESFEKISSYFGYILDFERLKLFPVYHICEYIINVFKLNINSDPYVDFFLNFVSKSSLSSFNHLDVFLEKWSKVKDKESIKMSDDVDAVKIMTVHKSKGLEFPVVFVPFNWDINIKNDNVWVDLPDKLYGDVNVSLVKVDRRLENTDYVNHYNKEKNKVLLDNYNLLYVAMTRAVSALVIHSFKYSDFSKVNCTGKFFSYYFNDLDKNKFQSGALFKEKKYYDKISTPINVKSFDSQIDPKLLVKHEAKKLWSLEDHKDSIDWGDLIHFFLSHLKYEDEIKETLNYFLYEGFFDKNTHDKVNDYILKLFSNKKVSSFFDRKWDVVTEKDILTPDGDSFVPDRLVIEKGNVKIIDYKTGKKRYYKEHAKQILKYQKLLSEISFYNNVESYLLYTDLVEVVKVYG